MNNATACAKKLTALLKKLGAEAESTLPILEQPIAVLVQSFLLQDSKGDKAHAAFEKIESAFVDFNDLRVAMPNEVVDIIGTRYPQALDRAERMRATLKAVFLREHDVSLKRLEGEGKRESRKYLESLDGITPYVAARVMLLCFDTHSIPVDEQLRKALVNAGAADEDADVEEVASWLTRQISADEGPWAHYALQRWAESRPARSRSPRKKPTAKKKTKAKTKTKSKTKKKSTRKVKA